MRSKTPPAASRGPAWGSKLNIVNFIRRNTPRGGVTMMQLTYGTVGVPNKIAQHIVKAMLSEGIVERRKCTNLPHTAYKYVIASTKRATPEPCDGCEAMCLPVVESPFMAAKHAAAQAQQQQETDASEP